MSYWTRAPKFKPASFCSHLQAGFILAAIGPQITSWHPTLWAVIAVAAGYAWEIGYWWCAGQLQPDNMITITEEGWPVLGRTWRVRVKNIDCVNDAFFYAVYCLIQPCEDRAKPSALDIVPFIIGAGLGLWFACTR